MGLELKVHLGELVPRGMLRRRVSGLGNGAFFWLPAYHPFLRTSQETLTQAHADLAGHSAPSAGRGPKASGKGGRGVNVFEGILCRECGGIEL